MTKRMCKSHFHSANNKEHLEKIKRMEKQRLEMALTNHLQFHPIKHPLPLCESLTLSVNQSVRPGEYGSKDAYIFLASQPKVNTLSLTVWKLHFQMAARGENLRISSQSRFLTLNAAILRWVRAKYNGLGCMPSFHGLGTLDSLVKFQCV